MKDTPYPKTGLFLRGRLRDAMTDREKDLLESCIESTESFTGEHTLLKRGQVYEQSTMVISGFLLRTMHADDRRHIVCLHVPGDFVDLHAFALKRLDHDIEVLGETTVGYVSHEKLQDILQNEPHLARLLWFSTLLDAAIHREWILKMGQLRTSARLAHLFAEIWRKLEMVGLARKDGFLSPLRQVELADICGASPIHVNRALRELREANIVDFRRGRAIVHDRAALERLGRFDPDYLYGEGDLRMQGELSAD